MRKRIPVEMQAEIRRVLEARGWVLWRPEGPRPSETGNTGEPTLTYYFASDIFATELGVGWWATWRGCLVSYEWTADPDMLLLALDHVEAFVRAHAAKTYAAFMEPAERRRGARSEAIEPPDSEEEFLGRGYLPMAAYGTAV